MASEAGHQGFEDVLKELEGIVQRLESGSLSLEDSLGAFEKGIGLIRRLTGTLNDVERRVEVLLREDGGSTLRVRGVEQDEGS